MRNVLFAVTHALPQIAEAKRLAREWFAAHPREPEPSSPLNRLNVWLDLADTISGKG